MPRDITMRIGRTEIKAKLNDSCTAGAIWDALPIRSWFNTWGDEIYFSIPVDAELESEKDVVDLGDIGYWPPGKAFCIFYGKTPASQGEEIRPASPVDIVGKVVGDPSVLREAVRSSKQIALERS